MPDDETQAPSGMGVPAEARNATKSVKNVAKDFDKAHVEQMMGNIKQNDVYCSKETAGVLVEFGDKPHQGERMDLAELRDAILAGKTVDDIVLDAPDLFHQYGRTLQKIEDVAARKRTRDWMTTGVWLHGPTCYCSDTPIGTNQWGCWFHSAIGSGVFFNVGTTLYVAEKFAGIALLRKKYVAQFSIVPAYVSRKADTSLPFMAARLGLQTFQSQWSKYLLSELVVTANHACWSI